MEELRSLLFADGDTFQSKAEGFSIGLKVRGESYRRMRLRGLAP